MKPMRNRWTMIAILLATFAFQAAHAQTTPDFGKVTSGPGWVYTRLGNQSDVQTPTKPGIVFEGGGTDVAAAYRWMCQHAGNGDFLVIRATGTPAYNPYIQRLCPGINSVSTLKITRRIGTRQPFVLDTIMKAEALFIAGGDQSDYVRFWQQTPLNHAIDVLARRGVPIGGTSAGNAILAQFAYSALTRSVTSHEALMDPFNYRITIDDGFLHLSPLLSDTITDDHFVTRDRMGRMVTFLARIAHDHYGRQPFGVAVDENTAFLMEANGRGAIVGSSAAYFVSTPGRPEVCKPETPLTFRRLKVYKITKGGGFDVGAWVGTGGTAYTVTATGGVLTSTQPGGSVY
jgi:cyanophycinase